MPLPRTRRDWIDIGRLHNDLTVFFGTKHKELGIFGSTVNQTFEAFVFASLVSSYKERGWRVRFVNPTIGDAPGKQALRLKFSTRGRPENYTYASCANDEEVLQIRHQLRVATRSYKRRFGSRANLVLDVAVIKDLDLSGYGTDDYVENEHLITFGEAKHMSAFAELIAGFLGIVHEMQPSRLKRRRFKRRAAAAGPAGNAHLSPFLFVSGFLYHTAQGLVDTITRRGFDVDVYSRTNQMTAKITVSAP